MSCAFALYANSACFDKMSSSSKLTFGAPISPSSFAKGDPGEKEGMKPGVLVMTSLETLPFGNVVDWTSCAEYGAVFGSVKEPSDRAFAMLFALTLSCFDAAFNPESAVDIILFIILIYHVSG